MAQAPITRKPGVDKAQARASKVYNQADLKNPNPPIESKTGQITGGDPALRSLLGQEFGEAEAGVKYFALDFDDYEDLLFMQTEDWADPHAEVAEGTLSSLVIERATRVVGQVPQGSVHCLSLQDQGKSLLMNLVLQNYVYPNANEQYDFKTKLWLWDELSNVYGSMPMVYDWVVRDDYQGPDCWLVPIRKFLPQQGRFSIQNSDWCMISTNASVAGLRAMVRDKVANWDTDAIQEILDKIGEAGKKSVTPQEEYNYLRHNPMFRWRRRSTWTNTGEIELVTKYEKGKGGRWITFAPDYGNIVVRNISNPHTSYRIPVVLKYGMPTLDSIIGLGDMERGRRIQYAIDDNLNLQREKQRLLTYPPLQVPNSGVIYSSLNVEPGAKWQMDQAGMVKFVDMPQSDASQNQTYNQLKGAMTNINGDSQTSVDADIAGSKGKTPAAIAAQQQSQNTRDTLDRWLMESAVQELIEGFIGLINSQQTEPIDLYMFGPEIKQIIQQGYDDVKDMVRFPGKTKDSTAEDLAVAGSAFIRIQPKRVQNENGYKFVVDAGSTTVSDQAEEHTRIGERIGSYLQNQAMLDAKLAEQGKQYLLAEDWEKWVISSGTKDWNDVIKDVPRAQMMPGTVDANGMPMMGAPGAVPGAPGAPTQPVADAGAPTAAPAPPAGLAGVTGAIPDTHQGTDSDIQAALQHINTHVAGQAV